MRHLMRRAFFMIAATAVLGLSVPAAALADEGGHDRGDSPGAAHAAGQGVTEAEDDTDELGPSQHPSGRDRTDHADSRQGNAASDPDDDGRGPDRLSHGTDKPGDEGGELTGDQDGNNGCGNDQDFEDDNEGWCGRPDFAGEAASLPATGSDTVSATGATGEAAAADVMTVDATTVVVDDVPESAPDEVLEADSEEFDDESTPIVVDDAQEVDVTSTSTRPATSEVGSSDAGAQVLGISIEALPTATAAVVTEPTTMVATSAMPASLPRTGLEMLPMALLGAGSVAAGSAMRRRLG